MSAQSLQAIIGTALIDDDFRKALLNGSRRRVLQSFELTGDEVEAIMQLPGESLEQFAGELHQLLLQSQGLREFSLPPTLPVKKFGKHHGHDLR